MSDELFEKIQQIIKEIKPSIKIINKGIDLHEDLCLDSLDTINFFFEVEKTFDINIHDWDIEKLELTNIDNIIKFIKKELNV